MKTVIFILGGKTDDDIPRERFRLRLEWAIYYYRNHQSETIVFLVSGRWGDVNEVRSVTEAEAGKRYILAKIPEATVIKEDISVDMIGNFAFSKPLIQSQNPDKVIIVTSLLFSDRINYLSKKVFADAFTYAFHPVYDELVNDNTLVEKEANAFRLLQKLFKNIADGDDSLARNTLLYKTPYYFKGVIDDKTFFDTYWEGGYAHFLHGLAVRNNKK